MCLSMQAPCTVLSRSVTPTLITSMCITSAAPGTCSYQGFSEGFLDKLSCLCFGIPHFEYSIMRSMKLAHPLQGNVEALRAVLEGLDASVQWQDSSGGMRKHEIDSSGGMRKRETDYICIYRCGQQDIHTHTRHMGVSCGCVFLGEHMREDWRDTEGRDLSGARLVGGASL